MDIFHHDVQTIIYRYIHQNTIESLNEEYEYILKDLGMGFHFNYRKFGSEHLNIYNVDLKFRYYTITGKYISPNYWFASTTFLQELKENELKAKSE